MIGLIQTTKLVLRNHNKIDTNGIFVLGHSLGGMLIPRIAKAEAGIAGFLSLAGSTRPLEDLALEQTKYILSLGGELTDDENKMIQELEEQVTRVKSPDLNLSTPAEDLPLGVPASYWLDLRGYDPATEVKDVGKPMLILQGERDYQVTMVDFVTVFASQSTETPHPATRRRWQVSRRSRRPHQSPFRSPGSRRPACTPSPRHPESDLSMAASRPRLVARKTIGMP